MKKLFLLLLAVLTISLSAAAQMRTVKGTVVYAGDGEPLVGVTVLPVGGGNGGGTSTDLDGNFVIDVPAKVTQLQFSYVGMITTNADITSGDMLVKLTNSENNLDEVMVVAYGTAKKSAYTGSASLVKAEDLEDRLVSNVTNALSGSVSGVQTTSSNGQPGTSATVRIRGIGSLYASNNPLYVLDGVPYDGDISAINPSDIESMTVLKDAAASALYGSRGANGVILITTKKGKDGEAKVTVDARWGSNSRQIKNYNVIESPEQYMELAYSGLYNSAFFNLGYDAASAHSYANSKLVSSLGYQVFDTHGQYLIGENGKFNPLATRGYSDGQYYYTPDNWADETFRNGLRQEYNVSVQGGTNRLIYFVSASYLQDEGIIDNSSFDRFTTRTNIEYQVKDWIKVGTKMSYINYTSQYPDDQTASASSSNAFGVANGIAPIYPFYVRDAQGNIMIDERFGNPVMDYGDGKSTNFTRTYMSISNPASDLIYNTEEYLADIFNGNWFATLTPVDGLTLRGTVGLTVDNTRTHYASNRYYGQSASYDGNAMQVAERTKTLTLQGLATYTKTFNNVHNFDATFVYESYDYNNEWVEAYGTGTYLDGNWTANNTLLSERKGYGAYGEYATRAYIGRLNYNYDNKYYFGASYRRDASSRFHPDNRWGNFFSISAGWDVAKEKFMDNAEWVDQLKLRASFGQTGNDNLGNNYLYIDQYTISGTDSWSDGVLSFKGNKDITWEKNNAFDIGIDYSFFQGKVSGSLDFFNRDTKDMLYYKPVTQTLGYSSIPMNIGSVRNNGLEFEINYQPITTRDITWDINFNATFLHNEILELAPELNGEMISGSRIYQEGESMYQFYLVKYAGVDELTGKALYWARNPEYNEDGSVKKDAKGKTVYGAEYATSDWSEAYNTNRTATGDLLPTVYGGISTNLKAYGFDFGIQCAYQLGGKMYDSGYQGFMHGYSSSYAGTNWHADILDAWTPTNTITDVPRINSSDNYTNSTSDRWMTSSNYFAINNITLGYTLPNKITKKWGIESVRIYGAADNLALWSARKGLDPRQSYTTATTSTYTAMRTISGGVKLVF